MESSAVHTIDEQDMSAAPVRLLFVDDDPGYLDLCRRRLSRLSGTTPYIVTFASTADEAVHLCMESEYDCLLVDFQLPDGSGTDVVDRIRTQNENQSVRRAVPPAIIVTADGGAHAATQAIRAGAVDFIAKRDLTEQALQRAVNHAVERSKLEASIVMRNLALEQANVELESANKQLEQRRAEILKFYHTVSHEVKTPLAAAREFVALVRDGVAGAVSPEQSELLGYAMDSCDHIRGQFTELLELARVDTGKVRLKRELVPIAGIIKRCAASIAEIARTKELHVDLPKVDPMLTAYCDHERIIQVLSNLLANAVKFTDHDGDVRVSVSTLEHPNRVEVKVTDTGCGIRESDLESIFERLYQVDMSTSNLSHSGLGLGLSISQEILKLHDSELSVSSEIGKGSSFSFILPQAAQPVPISDTQNTA